MAIPPSPQFERNLKALTTLQPGLADELADIRVPDPVVEATGRDGSRTFRVPGPEGGLVWFGRSSMPVVSTEALLGLLNGDGGNIALPGVLTGLEPKFLADRLAPHSAVVVLEPDPLAIKLAMHLHDYSDLIRDVRLVFVSGPDPTRSITEFIRRCPGFEMPTRILAVPQRTPAEFAESQRLLQSASVEVAKDRAVAVEALSKELKDSEHRHPPAVPRVAVLSPDARPAGIEQARRIERALESLGWTYETCIPDRPDRCHTIARLHCAKSVDADLVLLVNCGSKHLQPFLPENIAVASWFLPYAVVAVEQTWGLMAREKVFASSAAQEEALVGVGVPRDKLFRLDVAADVTTFQPTSSPPGGNAAKCDVAVLCDVPGDTPESANIGFSSHISLFNAMKTALQEEADDLPVDQAERILEQGERACGVSLRDDPVRNLFLGLLRGRLIPARALRNVLGTMIASDLSAELWGNGWEQWEETQGLRRGPIPAGEALHHLFNRTRVVLLPHASVESMQTALDALAAGTGVVCRAPARGWEEEYPSLGPVREYLNLYRNRGELRSAVRTALTASPPGAKRPRTERPRVLKDHTTAARLVSLWERMRD